jgi:hypothetical protein
MILTLLVGTMAAYADEADVSDIPGSGWWEASLVQNASTTDTANVVFTPVTALGGSGSGTPLSLQIAPGANVNVMPNLNLTLDDGFSGSAVVSSDQPIVAIGSIGNNPITSLSLGVTGGRAAAQYPGIGGDAVANTVAFPVVKNDYVGKTTTFYIQTVQAGTVYATYTMNDGANTYTASATTTADGMMATFSPDDVTTPSAIPTGCGAADHTCLGAAIFTSTVSLAGIYVEHNTTDDPAQILLSTRGFTPGDYSTTVVVPVVKSNWVARTTGIQIANVGTAASTITFTLAYQDGTDSAADGQQVVFSSVPAGSSVTFFPGDHGIFGGPFGGGETNEFVGSATITSDQPMTAIVNENDFAAPTSTKQTVFAAFAQAAGTDTILFPLVKEFYNGNTTGIQVMNVGDNPVTLSAAYVFQGNSFTVDEDSGGGTITVQPGAAFTFWGVTAYWSGTYDAYTGDYGGVTVTATGTDAAIVGIGQEAEFPAGGLGNLDTKNYEGFNQ